METAPAGPAQSEPPRRQIGSFSTILKTPDLVGGRCTPVRDGHRVPASYRLALRWRGLIVPFVLLILACSGTRPVTMPEFDSSVELTLAGIIDRDYLDQLMRADSGSRIAVPVGPLAPGSLTVSAGGSVVFADQSSGRLWGIMMPGANAGRPADITVGNSTLRAPGFVRADRVGNIYVSGVESGRVTICDPRLRPIGVIEPPYEALGLVSGHLSGVAFGLQGETYVADQTNAVVYRYDAAGVFVAAFGSEEAVWARLLRPAGLTCSPDGSAVYVCDPGTRRVVVFDPSGLPLRSFGGTDLIEPRNIAVDARGQCFVADEGARAVAVFSPQGRFIRSINGLPPRIDAWTRPTDVAVDDSLLWIADPGAGQIVLIAVRHPTP